MQHMWRYGLGLLVLAFLIYIYLPPRDSAPAQPTAEHEATDPQSLGTAQGRTAQEKAKQTQLAQSQKHEDEGGATLSGKALVDQEPQRVGQLYLLPQTAIASEQARMLELGEDGFFSFDHVAPGSYTLVLPQRPVEARDLWRTLLYHASRLNVVIADEDLVQLFHFPRLGSVFGRMVQPQRYQLRLVGELDMSTTTDEGGQFVFDQVPPGRYALQQVLADGEQRLLGDIQLGPGAVALDLGGVELDAASELLVQVKNWQRLGGKPVELVFLAEADEGMIVARRRLLPQAQQELVGLPSGRFKLGLAQTPATTSFVSEPGILTLQPSQVAELELELVPTTLVVIDGDPEGEPWQTLVLKDNHRRTRLPFQRVTGSGRPDLGAGRVLLQFNDWHAEAHGLKPGSYSVQVVSTTGKVAVLALELEANAELHLHASFPSP